MDGIPRFSFSRITTFEQCPRRYRYRYLDGVREAFRGVEAFMGQQVHAAIEWMHTERMAGRRPTSAEAVSFYCECWDRDLAAEGARVRVIRKGMEVESYRRRGAELVASFRSERFENDPLKTLAVEEHFDVVVGNGHRFQGYIDRVAVDADGRVNIIDYKTGRRAPATFEGKEADQVRAYALAMFLEGHDEPIDLTLDFLQAGRILTDRVRPEEVPDLERALTGRIETVLDSSVYPPSPGALCDWCGYNDLCEGYQERPRRFAPRAVPVG
jgi:putative RecB family exonuclease